MAGSGTAATVIGVLGTRTPWPSPGWGCRPR